MVFREGGKIVVSSAFDADQGDLTGIQSLQFFTVANGDEPIPGTVNDIGMTS
jgi:hypothetical protein